MPPEIFEGMMAVIAMVSMGGIVLIGMKMRYQHKARMLEKSKSDEDFERLADALDAMYEQARTLREDVGELQERIDFHERILTRGENEKGDADGG